MQLTEIEEIISNKNNWNLFITIIDWYRYYYLNHYDSAEDWFLKLQNKASQKKDKDLLELLQELWNLN